jgi:hypothetical protein
MSGVSPQITVTIVACWLLLTAAALVPAGTHAADVEAGPPTDRSVTVYRNPERGTGQPDLGSLRGFALVSEKHTVSLPAGESQLRFPGVADGVQPESAIVTGFPDGVLEKNHDAQVLSPAALVAATVGKPVTLVRFNRKTGATTRTTGTVRADNGSVVFESAEGIEALRCSGFPGTFDFTGTADLAPTPTLSVKVRTARPLTAQVTLSYLADGFDWSATYGAALSADARTLNLGAWVTLANSNGVSFPDAHVAVVAGRLNRVSPSESPETVRIRGILDLLGLNSSGSPAQTQEEVLTLAKLREIDESLDRMYRIDVTSPVETQTQAKILVQCWPARTTSDIPETPSPSRPDMLAMDGQDEVAQERDRLFEKLSRMFKIGAVQEEQLGDLKLYRVPGLSSVASRQMKQVRLLDRGPVPVTLVYVDYFAAWSEESLKGTERVLLTRNDAAHQLGIPLPAGQISTFTQAGDTPFLLSQAGLRDIAVGENFEIDAGRAADVQARSVRERRLPPARVAQIPLLPGIDVRSAVFSEVFRIEVTNSRRTAVTFEARITEGDGFALLRSTVTPFLRNGYRVMRVEVPAGSMVTLRYQIGSRVSRTVPHR